MTHTRRSLFPKRPRTGRPRPTVGQAAFCVMSTFCLILILRNAEAAVEYMGRGLLLCARTVIPSLFPFMVVSELLVESGAGEAFGRLFSRIMRRVFGLSGAGVSAVILGSMCGFPIGPRTAVSLYDRHAISREECEHLLTFTANPSSAFLVTGVGLSLFGDRRLGIILYGVVLGSAFFVGFLARFFLRRPTGEEKQPHYPRGFHPVGIEAFTSAVSSSAGGMTTVCAYVVFFSAITGALGEALDGRLGEMGFSLLSGLFEMTGGISAASTLSSRQIGLVLTAALAGWSGLSVHCQVIALCGGRGLSFRPYLLAKIAQGFLAGVVMAVILTCLGPTLLAPGQGVMAPGHDTLVGAVDALAALAALRDVSVPALISDVIFILGWIGNRLSVETKCVRER